MKQLQVLSSTLFEGDLKGALHMAYNVLHKGSHWRRYSITDAATARLQAIYNQMDEAVQSGHMGIRV